MDLRKRRSQEKLQLALARHLQKQTIDEITIGELTRSAGVSRQTFYSNFDSKQSILLNRIEVVFKKSRNRFDVMLVSSDIDREELIQFGLRCLLEECNQDKILMRAAFTGQAGIQCLALLKAKLAKLISDRMLQQFNFDIDRTTLDDISNFYAGAIIGVIQGWLINETSDKELSSIVSNTTKLILNGLDSFIKR